MKPLTAVVLGLLAAFSFVPGSFAEGVPAPAKLGKAPAEITPMDPQTAIRGVNAWFNSSPSLVSDFVQLGPNGRQSHGELYVQRPGRLRFDYAPPSQLEVIADGRTVAVRDRKLATQDEYFISQTPLKFLLKDPFDLARDTKVLDVQTLPDSIAIRVEDSTTFGGTSKIRLVFDSKTFELKQWAVVDPQGYETLVSLFNIDLHTKPDPQLFQIPPRERD